MTRWHIFKQRYTQIAQDIGSICSPDVKHKYNVISDDPSLYLFYSHWYVEKSQKWDNDQRQTSFTFRDKTGKLNDIFLCGLCLFLSGLELFSQPSNLYKYSFAKQLSNIFICLWSVFCKIILILSFILCINFNFYVHSC